MTLPRCPELLILPLAAGVGITPPLDGAGLTMATAAETAASPCAGGADVKIPPPHHHRF